MKNILVRKLSIENILHELDDLNHLKHLLFRDEQLYIFNHKPKKKLNYYDNENNLFNGEKMKNFINHLKISSCEIDKKLLKISKFDNLFL
jgi:hypothetical protein